MKVAIKASAKHARVAVSALSRAGILVGSLFIATSAHSDSEGGVTMQIPTPHEVVRTIVNTADVEDGASFEKILAAGLVEKRTENVKIFFAYDEDVNKAHVNTLIKDQIVPLLKSAGPASRLGFERVLSLNQANAILILEDKSSSGLARVVEKVLFDWFGESAQEFAPIKEAFNADVSGCFRFISAPSGEIVKSIGFTSTLLSKNEQETCIAKNLLFSLGLQGPAVGSSARNPEFSPRRTGILDDLALELLYRPGVRPKMSLDEAFNVP